jgi:hypothetical protein
MHNGWYMYTRLGLLAYGYNMQRGWMLVLMWMGMEMGAAFIY